ncbi:MAG: hypothetical protein R2747_07290 [Pyrinomonadaceae bacterium]
MNAEINHQSPVLPLVRSEIKQLLTQSEAFNRLPSDQKKELAGNMVKVAHYIVGGRDGDNVPEAAILADDKPKPPSDTTIDNFQADAAEQGTEQFTNLVKNVNFPEFVGNLVKGVFQAIVDSSIQQMDAYAELVKNVAKSVDQYMKDNVSENQARDYLVDRYPEHLELDLNGEKPQVKTKNGYDENNMPDFFAELGLKMPMDSFDDDSVEQQLVPAARQRLAMDRQQLLATMVLMGINRLVVTNGSIKAKVLFKLNTTDLTKRSYHQTATSHFESKTKTRPSWWKRWFGGYTSQTDSSRTLDVETIQDSDDEKKVEMAAQLSGDVNINFKSETFPLDRMTNILGVEDLQQRYSQTAKNKTGQTAGAGGN